MKKLNLGFCLLFVTIAAFSQPSYTANNQVPEYDELFTFGTNLGYTAGWSDEQKATIAAGSESLGIKGAGSNSLRLKLPESFLEQWGYGVRTNAFSYYKELGMSNLTVFIEGPSDAHMDKSLFGAGTGSKMFKNMYAPIWDNGENGTLVNDTNYLALYIYKTAMQYGENVSFWEIWNEPDFTYSSFGWKSADYADNWWIRDPKPEELTNLQAPVQHYVRALRVCYEVIKSVNENAFICTGGIGYASFLDAILRNTDNPDGGNLAEGFPLAGGAYFDCVSYHNYPHFSLGQERHSDKAKEVLIRAKQTYESLLATYGYDGTTFPKKQYIITETNIPHTQFNSSIGSPEAQRNYLVKAIVACQKNGISSLHNYGLNDERIVSEMTGEFNAMGLFKSVSGVAPYNQEIYPSGIACGNTTKFLKSCKYSAYQTSQMLLPSNVDGAAFVNADGKYKYVLWAKTNTDNSESATYTYTFPTGLVVGTLTKYDWDYDGEGDFSSIGSRTVQLTGTPCFISDNGIPTSVSDQNSATVSVFPCPIKREFTVKGVDAAILRVALHDAGGRTFRIHTASNTNTWRLSADMPSGLYVLTIETADRMYHKKILLD